MWRWVSRVRCRGRRRRRPGSRFNGVDPDILVGQPGVSPYAYVADRPTFLRDPSGARPCSSDDNHDKAQLFALARFASQYEKFNVYGDCPGWREYQGRVGKISLTNTVPRSDPDILVGQPGATLLYEIKPAANQLGEIVWGVTGKRGDNNAAQVQRYLWALSYAGYPNPQPGPNIVPATTVNADGTITTIFSGVDWNKFAPKSARPDIRNVGIIYYITQKRPKIPSRKRVPKPVPVPVPVPQPGTQPVPSAQPTDTPGWVVPAAIGLCIVGGLLIVGTIVEDLLTGGIGIADDAPSFAGAAALFKLAFSL